MNLFESEPIPLRKYEWRVVVNRHQSVVFQFRKLDKSEPIVQGHSTFSADEWISAVRPGYGPEIPDSAFALVSRNRDSILAHCKPECRKFYD